AANLLKPALARGELRTIAATTWSEYKKYFEKDAALERRFQPVKVDEPSEEIAVTMVRGLRAIYEKSHGSPIRDEAVVAAVKLSSRFLAGRQLPDKAVDLLDTAAARVTVEQNTKPESLVMRESELASLKREREALGREKTAGHPIKDETITDLDGRIARAADDIFSLTARWEGERAAVTELRKARAALTAAPD